MRNAKEFRDTAWNILRGRYWWAVLAALIAGILGGTAGQPSVTFNFNPEDLQHVKNFFSGMHADTVNAIFDALKGVLLAAAGYAFTYGIAFFIVGSAIELGYDLLNVSFYQSTDRPKIETVFSRFSIFGNALLLRFLMFLKTFLWTLLFIVPGIVAAFRYALAPYILAEHPELSATEAIERSKQLMLGHKGRLFCLEFSFIGWYLLSALTGGIGIVFLTPYVKAAVTAFYLERTGRLPLADGGYSAAGGVLPVPPQDPSGRELI
ncbi:MAG: DUF975 family protein [Eubacteriales bacterium]|nr:DUF975 family protein [Eubacteriales bacterium]